jgi:hypothetical protein
MQHFLNFILIIKTKILKEREKDQPAKGPEKKERKERKRNKNKNRPSVYVVDFPSKRKGL